MNRNAKRSLLTLGLLLVGFVSSAMAVDRSALEEMPLAYLIRRMQPPATIAERLQAAEVVGTYGAEAVEALMPLLRSENRRSRFYACVALQRLGATAEPAVDDLVKLVDDPTEPCRSDAVYALRAIGSGAAPAVPSLAKLVRTETGDLRYEGFLALGSIGPAAFGILVENLQQSDTSLKVATCQAIRHMQAPPLEAIDALVSMTSESDNAVRDAAFLALGDMGSAAIESLVPLTCNADVQLRRRAVMALSRMGSDAQEALPYLCQRLEDSDDGVRFWAAKALGNLGVAAEPAVGKLVQVIDDEDADVRWQVAQSLAQVAAPEVAEEVLRRMLEDPHPDVRNQANNSLQRLR